MSIFQIPSHSVCLHKKQKTKKQDKLKEYVEKIEDSECLSGSNSYSLVLLKVIPTKYMPIVGHLVKI